MQRIYSRREDTAVLPVTRSRRRRELAEVLKFDAGDIMLCMTQLDLSARLHHRMLKLARTIAGLAGMEDIQSMHLAEALQYRPKLMIG